MKFVDRLLTIVVTATLTSAAWILYGSVLASGRTLAPPASEEEAAAAADYVNKTADTQEAGVPQGYYPAGDWVIPVRGVRADQLTDTFTDKRGGGSRLHEALDIMAARGTPVVAAAEGTVEKLFLSDAGGKTVYARSPDRRTIYYYAHLDGYAPGLKEGQKLARGDAIGTVGSTGNASPEGPHLHFAILRTTPDASWYDPATAIDPFPLLTGSGG